MALCVMIPTTGLASSLLAIDDHDHGHRGARRRHAAQEIDQRCALRDGHEVATGDVGQRAGLSPPPACSSSHVRGATPTIWPASLSGDDVLRGAWAVPQLQCRERHVCRHDEDRT